MIGVRTARLAAVRPNPPFGISCALIKYSD
jgi:hypothetical protein